MRPPIPALDRHRWRPGQPGPVSGAPTESASRAAIASPAILRFTAADDLALFGFAEMFSWLPRSGSPHPVTAAPQDL
jgi:hypothetical protein